MTLAERELGDLYNALHARRLVLKEARKRKKLSGDELRAKAPIMGALGALIRRLDPYLQVETVELLFDAGERALISDTLSIVALAAAHAIFDGRLDPPPGWSKQRAVDSAAIYASGLLRLAERFTP